MSLSDSLASIAAKFEPATKTKVSFNFGGTGLLARQLEEGASADIFFSADEEWMDRLEAKGLIQRGTRVNRLSNTLVAVVSSESPAPVSQAGDLAKPQVKRIALADPALVPAGKYAKAFLEAARLWDAIAPKIVPTENVRAALSAVEAGNADVAFVYRTDARTSNRAKIAFEVPAENLPRIVYPVAMLAAPRAPKAARQFLDYLAGEEAAREFARHGFEVMGVVSKP